MKHKYFIDYYNRQNSNYKRELHETENLTDEKCLEKIKSLSDYFITVTDEIDEPCKIYDELLKNKEKIELIEAIILKYSVDFDTAYNVAKYSQKFNNISDYVEYLIDNQEIELSSIISFIKINCLDKFVKWFKLNNDIVKINEKIYSIDKDILNTWTNKIT